MDRISLIRSGKPINFKELTFYPITVSNLEIFESLKMALVLRQSTMPVKYMAMDYVSALFFMDFDATLNEKSKNTGLFAAFLKLVYLSLRIDEKQVNVGKSIYLSADKNKQIKLDKISFNQEGKTVFLTALELSNEVRKLIAEQNGVELPDETENAELVKDSELKKQLKNKSGKTLKANTDDLLFSIATYYKKRQKEILGWTIREFYGTVRAIERANLYNAYLSAELSGMVSFKDGNPVPSFFYDVSDNSLGTVSLSDIGNALGKN